MCGNACALNFGNRFFHLWKTLKAMTLCEMCMPPHSQLQLHFVQFFLCSMGNKMEWRRESSPLVRLLACISTTYKEFSFLCFFHFFLLVVTLTHSTFHIKSIMYFMSEKESKEERKTIEETNAGILCHNHCTFEWQQMKAKKCGIWDVQRICNKWQINI